MIKWNIYEIVWVSAFSLAAIVLAVLQHDSLLGLSTFITGIFCVLLAAKGNILTYPIGMYNTLAYAYLSYTNGLYGEMGLNLLFFVPMNIVGFISWKKHLNDDKNTIEMKRLNTRHLIILCIVCFVLIIGLGWALSLIKGQNTPYIDATTNILSIAATILMVWRYREQWLLYILLNIFTIIIWIIRTMQGSSDGLMMIIMWVAFLTNALYGYYLWSKGSAQQRLIKT